VSWLLFRPANARGRRDDLPTWPCFERCGQISE
jgi:hypothetical protein